MLSVRHGMVKRIDVLSDIRLIIDNEVQMLTFLAVSALLERSIRSLLTELIAST